MKIGDLCHKEIITMTENSFIIDAAKLMAEHQVGSVFVVKNPGDMPVGIITDRDIVIKILSQQVNLEGVTVAEAMHTNLFCIDGTQGIKETIEAMSARGVRRAPVVENGRVCGVISSDDLIEVLAKELSDLSQLIHRQLEKEKREERELAPPSEMTVS